MKKRLPNLMVAGAALLLILTGSALRTAAAPCAAPGDAAASSDMSHPASGSGGTGRLVPPGAPQSKIVLGMEHAVLRRVNRIREAHGLRALVSNEALNAVARDYSRKMSHLGFFSHYDPTGRSVADRLRARGLTFRLAAENIFQSTNFSDPVAVAVEGWMESDGHRANILGPGFTETGIGIWRDGDRYHFTQIFIRPR